MKIYYYERIKSSFGPYRYQTDIGDEGAVKIIKKACKNDLMCIYTENPNTPDGTPFIMLYEKDKS